MNERRKRALYAKHPSVHLEFCDMRTNKKTEMRMKKVIFMTRKVERRLGFIADKKLGELKQNDYVSNTGVTIDSNDLEGTVLLSEIIWIKGDIPYEQEIEE